MASSQENNFNIELFIIDIQNHPVIWDQTKREYSDRSLKKQAWEDICRTFFEDFEEKTVKEKNEAAVTLQKKWKGIRDNYHKDRNKKNKSGSGASTSKEYLYSHLLSFLNPVMQTRPSKTPLPAPSDEDHTSNINIPMAKKAKKPGDNCDDLLIQSLLKRMNDRCSNRDRSVEGDSEYNFALSLVDDIKAIHPDYKMDAKMEIMGILKKYKQMSNYPPNYSGYYTTPEPHRNVSAAQPTIYHYTTPEPHRNVSAAQPTIYHNTTPEPPRNESSQRSISSPSVFDDTSNTTEDLIYGDFFTEG